MESPATGPQADPAGPSAVDPLRQAVGQRLGEAEAQVAAATVAGIVIPGASDADRRHFGGAVARLLRQSVAGGGCDPRQDAVTGLVTLVNRLGLDPSQVCLAVHAAMTAASVAVSTHGRLAPAGGSPESPGTTVIQRAAFDVLAAWTTRALELPTTPALTDTLTTLHTRVMLDTVLLKECQRAERFEHWLSLLLIDLDHLGEVNRTRGYGVGDQVLERMGVLIRKYFRQQDWVARYREDVVAVLLPETGPEDAATLANLMRTMLEERLTMDDDRPRPMSVSIAVASARPLNGYPIDADRLIEEADAALQRAKDGDRSRLELIEIHPVVEPRPDSGADD
jgi:diguanylate cyclase (GGDEF)-like protein